MIIKSLFLVSILIIFMNVKIVPREMKFSGICQESNQIVSRFLEIKGKDEDDKVLIQTQERVKESLNVLDEALQKFDFNELSISYNGGKDCLVMLILYLSSLSNRFTPQELDSHQSLKSVYINYEPQFPELIEFISTSTSKYKLDLTSITMQLKEGFTKYLSENPQIKAIIVGTRRSDPYASDLNHFQKTDHGWPEFIRIHPVINWHYDEIWCFLKTLKIDYCKLYDQGFTSLGGVDTTIRNPGLKLQNGNYLPAYELKGDEKERDGRNIDRSLDR